MADQERDHDIVVYGASGFVGALTADYLARKAPAGARIALAGRSRAKVEAVRAGLPEPARSWPVLVADSSDAAALDTLAGSTRVLATTVGPYAKYGLPVVLACARAGTHYADLTGETIFARAAIDGCDEIARTSGARLVNSCGYDSIPSDLGVLMLHEQVAADGAGELTDVRLRARFKGGLSGGTADSMRQTIDIVARDPAAGTLLRDPFALSPDRGAETTARQPSDTPRPRQDGDVWVAPFVMAGYNTRVVRRSNALLDWAYGKSLTYSEVAAFPGGPGGAVAAIGSTAGLGAFAAGFRFRPTRALLDRVLPKPGEGPGAAARANGWFRMDIDGTTSSARRYTARVSASGDPGYAATAEMFGESALCLAFDTLPDRAGVLTPATAMGTVLIDRLRAVGHTYTVTAA